MKNTHQDTLKLRRVAIDTYKENVAYLHRNCAIYRTEGFQALSKVEITTVNGDSEHQHRVLAVLNVVDDESITKCDELGLSEQAFAQLDVKEGHCIRIAHAEPPASLSAVHRKIAGERLELDDFRGIARDIA